MKEGLPLDTSNYGAQSNTSCDAHNVDAVLQSPYSPGLDTKQLLTRNRSTR